MAKLDVWAKKPKTRTAQTRTFQDIDEDTGELDGLPFTLTFWRMTETEETRAIEESEKLIEQYLGDPDNNIKPSLEGGFPPVGGQIVEITKRMCLNAAVMEMMQPPDAPERYDADQFIAMRARLSEQTRNEIARFMQDVKKKKKAEPNETHGDTNETSGSA